MNVWEVGVLVEGRKEPWMGNNGEGNERNEVCRERGRGRKGGKRGS